jgi:predicted ATP-grasp superfamily ATP-dependent carboligase
VSGRTVIVTDGRERAALAVVRSLGRAGYRCVVGAPTSRSLAGASRYASREIQLPDALGAPEAFAAAIRALVAQEGASLLIPIAEPAILALLPDRDALRPCVIPFPDIDAFRAISDKERLLNEARALGIAVPGQHIVTAHDDDLAALDTLGYPLVLKPARSVGESGGERAKLSVTVANSARDARAQIGAMSRAAFPLLAQQRVVGPGIGIFTLTWDGALRAVFAHRRLTEKPPWGGVSVYRESVPLDTALLAQSRTLLDRFGWYGVAMVEYKRDLRTGTPFLMEINGRFWGSLQLAIDAGVDFPRLLAALALSHEVPDFDGYRQGVRSRWTWGQIDHVLTRLRHPRLRATLPPGTVGLGRAIADLVAGPFRPHDRDEVFRWTDPRPAWRETADWFRRR